MDAAPKRSLGVICLNVFIDLLGFGMVLPLLAYYGTRFHATAEQMAFLTGAYSTAQLLLGPVWGGLSDRCGRRPVILTCIVGIAAAWLAFATARTYAVLLLARIFSGAFSANVSTSFAYVSDVTTPEQRAHGMGQVGAAYALGFVMGPAVGALAGRHDLMLPPLLAAILSLVNFGMAWRWLPETRRAGAAAATPPAERIRALADPMLVRWGGALLALMMAYSAAEVTLPYRLALDPFHFSPLLSGMVFAYIGVVAVAGQGAAVSRLVARHGEVATVAGGALVFATGMLMMAGISSGPALLLACTLMAAGQACCYPSLLSLISREAAESAQGIALGLTQSLSSLGRMLGPFGSGYLYVHAGPGWPWIGGAASLALVLLAARPAQSPSRPRSL